MNFYYRYGSSETTNRWSRPTWDRIHSWWDEFKLVDGVEDYDFYVVGGVLYDIDNTKDCDINFIGEIKDIKKLENILNSARQIGFKYSLFIDIFWMSSIRYCYEDITINNGHYYLRATVAGEEVLIVDDEVKKNKVIDGNMFYFFDNLENNIRVQSIYYPNLKHLNKPKGYNTNKPILLK